MTLREVLAKGIELLKKEQIEAPAADAGVLLCHVLGSDRAYLYAYADVHIAGEDAEKYSKLLDMRCTGMPVQYITGHQEFMSLDFEVGSGVLIPRHDTEILVEAVIDLCRVCDSQVRILDIGTGSGCIAVSLAYYIKNCSVVSVDISERALEIAQLNALKNGVADRIKFIRSDLFCGLQNESFDIIVSNPPYLRNEEIKTLQREVRDFEPAEALDGGEEGLEFYREITLKAPGFLKNNGFLAFEVGYSQAADVIQLMKNSFADIKVLKDLAGIDRVIVALLQQSSKGERG